MSVFASGLRVAVLRGGPSPAYEQSLRTGTHVLSVLRELPDTYEPVDIFISRDGEWHKNGLSYEPHAALHGIDVVWNALHGSYGEDGTVQRLLEKLQIPFTGSSSVSAAMASNKDLAKEIYSRQGFHTPRHELVTDENLSDALLGRIFRNYMHPVYVKPVRGTESFMLKSAHSSSELLEAIRSALAHAPRVLVEEGIRGEEASCAVIEGVRGEDVYPLMPLGRFTVEQNKSIEQMAQEAHHSLGLRHYSSSDFIVTSGGKIYILETNALPPLDEDSNMHKSMLEVGFHPREFVPHVIGLALERTI